MRNYSLLSFPKKGVNINAETTDGKTALNVANMLENKIMARFLVGKGGAQTKLKIASNIGEIKQLIRKIQGFIIATSITEVKLEKEKIGPTGSTLICAALRDNTTVKKVDLANNDFGTAIEPSKELGDLLSQNSVITELNLNANTFDDEKMQNICLGLVKNKSVKLITFVNNKIGVDGAKALGEVLEKNAVLENLNLQENSIGSEGAKFFADGLTKNKSLKVLNLYRNNLGDAGSKLIFDALKTNNSLLDLNIALNTISPAGAKAIGEFLRTNATLTSLNLLMNEVKDEGAKHIAEGLKFNKTLRSLNIKSAKITAEGTKALNEAKQQNPALQDLNLVIS